MIDRSILLSIIIVNYNGLRFIKDCLDSIAINCENIPHEIVMVDNDSKDESHKFVKEHYPEVFFVKNKENVGFAQGNNIGVQRSKGQFLLLLNNDTVLLDPLDAALEFISSNSEVGVIGALMLDGEHNLRLSTGKFPNVLNFIKLSSIYNHFEDSSASSLESVDWIEGSFLLTNRENWDRVSGMDTSFFMYVEDMDFCKKISLLGKQAVLFRGIRYIHYGGFSVGRNDWLLDSYKIFVKKHKRGVDRIFSLIVLNIGFWLRHAKNNIKKHFN